MDATTDVDDILSSPATEFGRVVVLTGICMLSQVAMLFMNRTTIHNERAVEVLKQREDGRALITVSNHTRCALGTVDLSACRQVRRVRATNCHASASARDARHVHITCFAMLYGTSCVWDWQQCCCSAHACNMSMHNAPHAHDLSDSVQHRG